MSDDDTADDGATHHFWSFIIAERLKRHPRAFAFGLEDIERMRAAIEAFDDEAALP